MKHQRWTVFGQQFRRLRQALSPYQYCGRAIQLVWTTNRRLTIALLVLSLISGILPGAIAYVGKLIVDSVVMAAQSGLVRDRWHALGYLGLEAILVIIQAGCRQGLTLSQSLLQMLLGHTVNELILEKALTLDLKHFEDSEFHDKMMRAKREASFRPLGFITRTFSLMQDTLSIVTYGGLLLQFSGWAVLILVLAAIPAFVSETRFAEEAFLLAHWRTPAARQQHYLEWLLSNDNAAMEVKLYQLGELLLNRYRAIFQRLFAEDRNLVIRRGVWSYALGLLSTAAFYGAYVWILLAAIARQISLGDLTMYLVVFRQGQGTVSSILSAISGMYEDSLYLSNLYEFLEQEISQPSGSAIQGSLPGDGLRFEQVSFHYPGSSQLALKNVSLHLKPGEKLAIVGENGSGKTTLIKLLTRLYTPDSGRVLLDGLDLREWDIRILQQRIGVIFQNFVRYQFTVGENIGAGDVDHFGEESHWQLAAEKGTAHPFIVDLPEMYQTQLGRWFKDGRELSGGQWQKVALARAFMRKGADILVLDEPTSAMDAEAEIRVFNHVRTMTQTQMAILISHRFSTVRMADQIIVLVDGEIIERGTHAELVQAGGRYARLFELQAAGYQ
jgi:ABC-type multidrug transport system fused ATPase/permease subunit